MGIFLHVWGEASDVRWRVAVSHDPFLPQNLPPSSVHRVSPLFPVVPAKAPPDPLLRPGYIGFFCPLNALGFVSKQIPRVQERLWFSHGLASAILFSAEADDFGTVDDKRDGAFSAYEIWHVDPDGLISVHAQWHRPTQVPPVTITDYTALGTDARQLLIETELNLRDIVRGSARYFPELVPRFQLVVDAVNEIIKELRFFRAPATTPLPESLSSFGPTMKDDVYGLHRRTNQRLTQLIQLNSSLVYVRSQAFEGRIPILSRPSHFSQYSLLGIGTAFRALAAMTAYIEDVFAAKPVLAAMENTYRIAAGFEVYPLVTRYQVSTWRNVRPSFDHLLNTLPAQPVRPKTPYFSARLGFGESPFCVTAATQILHASDSVRWSLMTLTHELLHAHVTGILTTIFSGNPSSSLTDDAFDSLHQSFVAACEAARNEKPCIPATAIDSLRFAVFAFAANRGSLLDHVRGKGSQSTPIPKPQPHAIPAPLTSPEELISKGDVPLWEDVAVGPAADPAEFKKEFCDALRLLEEVMVHTLDLHYFYAGDTELFLSLLWDSWTTVPAVVGDIDTYLLRSMAAVSALDRDDNNHQRFKRAATLLDGVLDKLIFKNPANEFLRRAKRHLTENRKQLQRLAYATAYIADITAVFLHSKQIETAFWSGDINIDRGEKNEFTYTLATGDFLRGKVANPVPLLADRLRRDSADYGGMAEDYRSAWLLLAVASTM